MGFVTGDDEQRHEEYFALKAKHGLDAEAAEAWTKQQLHGVQLALERYAVEGRQGYPDSLDQLVLQSFIQPGFYPNGFSGTDSRPSARDVPFGWSAIAPGNLTYLKLYDAEDKVATYKLVGYGARREGTQDVDLDGEPDGAIIVLTGSARMPDGSWPVEHTTEQHYMAHGELIVIPASSGTDSPSRARAAKRSAPLPEGPYRQLEQAMSMLQLSIERFAVDSEGLYPREVGEIVDTRLMKGWPENPFQPGELMKPLRPGDPAEAGAFVYIGWGPIISISSAGQVRHEVSTTGSSTPPLPDSAGVQVREIDQYILVAYGPEGEEGVGSPPESALRPEVRRYERGKAALRSHPLADGIDWDRVVVVLSAGEDYTSEP